MDWIDWGNKLLYSHFPSSVSEPDAALRCLFGSSGREKSESRTVFLSICDLMGYRQGKKCSQDPKAKESNLSVVCGTGGWESLGNCPREQKRAGSYLKLFYPWFPCARNWARKAEDPNGRVRTSWSNRTTRGKCTDSGSRDVHPENNTGTLPGSVEMGQGKLGHSWSWI